MGKKLDFSLQEDEKKYLESILRTRTEKAHIVQRARILILKDSGLAYDPIAEKVGVNRNTVILCIKKIQVERNRGRTLRQAGTRQKS